MRVTPHTLPTDPSYLNRFTGSTAEALPASWCAATVALRCPPVQRGVCVSFRVSGG